MGDIRVLEPTEHSVLHKIDSGAMRFHVKIPHNLSPVFRFTSKHNPQKILFKMTIGRVFKVKNMTNEEEIKYTYDGDLDFDDFTEFWVTWYNKKIKMGTPEQPTPLFIHKYTNDDIIGYVQFDVIVGNRTVDWMIEETPGLPEPLPCKILDDDLTWAQMSGNKLPPNALIGGFEKEPVYIARTHFHNSLVPGKYVNSLEMAFVPWGHREHGTRDFEILCGHNAKWVKTEQNFIPPDAFVAGYSEVRREPLYVGRAMHDNCLVVGKVHVLYKTCYLPYHGKEIEKSTYEILTVPKIVNQVNVE